MFPRRVQFSTFRAHFWSLRSIFLLIKLGLQKQKRQTRTAESKCRSCVPLKIPLRCTSLRCAQLRPSLGGRMKCSDYVVYAYVIQSQPLSVTHSPALTTRASFLSMFNVLRSLREVLHHFQQRAVCSLPPSAINRHVLEMINVQSPPVGEVRLLPPCLIRNTTALYALFSVWLPYNSIHSLANITSPALTHGWGWEPKKGRAETGLEWG